MMLVKKLIWMAVISAGLALILGTGCEEKEVLNVLDDQELVRYIRQVPTATELFRTENLITDDPYYKDADPSAEFRDLLDSTTRNFYWDITPDSVRKFFDDFGEIDDAEVTVVDVFFIRIQRVEGTDTTIQFQERVLTRHAYFLRLGSDAYSGWVLHGFRGGTPRAPTVGLQPTVRLRTMDGKTFFADGLNAERFTYLQSTWRRQTNPTTGQVEFKWDTTAGHSNQTYVALYKIPEISDGTQMELRISGIPTSIPNATVYQKFTMQTDSGFTTYTMSRVPPDLLIDTIRTPDPNENNFNLIFFQEFQYVDRPGGIWVAPYRTEPFQ